MEGLYLRLIDAPLHRLLLHGQRQDLGLSLTKERVKRLDLLGRYQDASHSTAVHLFNLPSELLLELPRALKHLTQLLLLLCQGNLFAEELLPLGGHLL